MRCGRCKLAWYCDEVWQPPRRGCTLWELNLADRTLRTASDTTGDDTKSAAAIWEPGSHLTSDVEQKGPGRDALYLISRGRTPAKHIRVVMFYPLVP